MKFDIVIPYKQRLNNIALAFESLAEQTMPSSEYRVVIGAMEYDPGYIEVCRSFEGRLDILSVHSATEWNVCQARNLALQHITADVTILMDADVILPPKFLDTLYNQYFAQGQNVCVSGQVLGYGDLVETDVHEVKPHEYSHYRKVLADLEAIEDLRIDKRWLPEYDSLFARFPWVVVRGGLIALPTATIREHNLYFDDNFRGWGPEDQEWSLRVAKTGIPMLLGDNVFGVHLPHFRDVAANGAAAAANNRYYLTKWPHLGLEVALAFGGWLETDRILPAIEQEIADAVTKPGNILGVARGTIQGREVIFIGVELDPSSQQPIPALTDFDSQIEVLQLTGFTLPYADHAIDESHVLAAVRRLSDRLRTRILSEAQRVATRVIERQSIND